MKRLIVVSHSDLNETRERTFRLDFLAASGIPVEYWDLSPLYGEAPNASTIGRSYVRHFLSLQDLEAALRAILDPDRAILVPGLTLEPRHFPALMRLSRSRVRLCRALVGLHPSPPSRGIGDKARLLAHLPNLWRIMTMSLTVAARKLGLVRSFDMAFVAGADARGAVHGVPSVGIHHPDYDDWNETRSAMDRPVAGRYGVFIDQYFANHPDYASEGVSRRIRPQPYYDALNAYFARLEDRHGAEIVIAAHPKADYTDNPFQGRKIYQKATHRLGCFCEFAVTSYSTAISYPILGRRPLVFIDTDDLRAVHRPLGVHDHPRHFAAVLGARYVNLDHPEPNDARFNPVDETLYDSYKYRYIVSRENESLPTREILRRFLSDEASAPLETENSR